LSAIGGVKVCGCPDKRVNKSVLVFGGSAGYTFGWYYFVLADLAGKEMGQLFLVYGCMQFALSCLQSLTLFPQLLGQSRGTLQLKAHLQGCGYTTAWSVFWPLFWLQKIPFLSWVVLLRDLLTIVDYLASLIPVIVLSVIFGLLTGRWIIPTISSVDRSHEAHGAAAPD
jgi:hypothetical protein